METPAPRMIQIGVTMVREEWAPPKGSAHYAAIERRVFAKDIYPTLSPKKQALLLAILGRETTPTYYIPTDDGPIWPEVWPASVGYFKSRAGYVTTDKRGICTVCQEVVCDDDCPDRSAP